MWSTIKALFIAALITAVFILIIYVIIPLMFFLVLFALIAIIAYAFIRGEGSASSPDTPKGVMTRRHPREVE